MSNLDANGVVALFLERRPEGGWLTAKQAAWVRNVARNDDKRYEHQHLTISGRIDTASEAVFWELLIPKNGAGLLKISRMAKY